MQPISPVSPITTTQLFSRSGIGYLWGKRADLDPNQTSILKSMYDNKRKGSLECQQTITYKLSQSKAGQLGYGRLYGTKGSLETLERECRGTVCRDYYHDVDIVNCHPVLLVQLARTEFARDLPEVERYVDDRDAFLAAISSNREEAKSEVIRILYGGTCKNDALTALSTEVRAFSKFLSSETRYRELFAACKSADNIYGTFLSYVLQTEERKCMMSLKRTMETAGWSVDVLAYDGVMIRKRADASCDAELLSSAAEAIKAETGYTVRLLNKEFSYFDIPVVVETKNVAEGITLEAYQEMKERFEVNHFYYEPTDRICKFTPATGKLLQMGKEHAAMALMAEWSFQTGATAVNTTAFLPLWCKDPKRRVVTSIDMKPSEDPKVFSTFNGFPFTHEEAEAPVDAANRVTVFNTLLDVLAPEPEMRAILVEWMAHLIQKPFENSMTCVVLAGGKGCGKDTLGDLLLAMLGDKYTQNYNSTNQFWDKHDEGRMGKLFVKLEEAVGATNRQNEAEFKSRITSCSMMVNPKGMTPITTPNYARYMLTTNDMTPVKLDAQERRFVVIQCGRSKIGDMAFWTTVRQTLFCPKGYRAVGDWLAAQPIGAFPRVLPKSEMAQDMIDTETPSEQLFLESSEWDGAQTTASDLFTMYRSWCLTNGAPAALNTQTFGRRLMLQKAEGRINSKRTSAAVVYWRSGGPQPAE